jgi:tetratricopeptide (TPR) repeat protein
MKVRLLLLAMMLAATRLYAQGPNYQELAQASFDKNDYRGTRQNLRSALEQATVPREQIELRRKIAVTYIFEGDYDDASEEYEEIIAQTAASGLPPEAHDRYALAAIAALRHEKDEVLKHVEVADSLAPRNVYAPLFHAIVWAYVDELERVLKAKALMEATAAAVPADTTAQNAAALTRAIYATKIRAFDVARAEIALIGSRSLRAFGNAFLANGLRREGRGRAGDLNDEVRKFKEMSIYSAVAWRMIR